MSELTPAFELLDTPGRLVDWLLTTIKQDTPLWFDCTDHNCPLASMLAHYAGVTFAEVRFRAMPTSYLPFGVRVWIRRGPKEGLKVYGPGTWPMIFIRWYDDYRYHLKDLALPVSAAELLRGIALEHPNWLSDDQLAVAKRLVA